MKSKSRKWRDRAKRLGLTDPTLTSGVKRDEINAFYKRGGRSETKFDKIKKQERKQKQLLKALY